MKDYKVTFSRLDLCVLSWLIEDFYRNSPWMNTEEKGLEKQELEFIKEKIDKKLNK